MKNTLLIIFAAALLSSCSPEVIEKTIRETDTVFQTRTERIYDTVYKYRTKVKQVTDSIYIRDTLQPDTLTLRSNYATARAWLDWPQLKGTIEDKDTTLSYYQDSSRRIIEEKEKQVRRREEVRTKIIKKKYVPWWIYLLWGASLGVVLLLRFKL